MDSSEESSDIEEVSDQPGPSQNINQAPLEESIDKQIGLEVKI